MHLTEGTVTMNLAQKSILADFVISHERHPSEFEKDGNTSGEKQFPGSHWPSSPPMRS
jgi:hypothetical protein